MKCRKKKFLLIRGRKMLDKSEYQSIFSALDKRVNSELFKNIILDKCDDGSANFSSNDSVYFDDKAKERLHFFNNLSALVYSAKYNTVLLSNNIERDIDEKTEKETHIALGATNFIFFYEYGAKPNNVLKAIAEMMNYLDIKNLDELRSILESENVNSDTIKKSISELKGLAPDEASPIIEATIEQMCQSFLEATDSEVKGLLEKIQESIDPKFIVMTLYRQDLIGEEEYDRLRYILDTRDEADIDNLEIFLEPKAMLALNLVDNSFKLVKDGAVGYKITEILELPMDIKKIEFSYLDLVEITKDENAHSKALIDILLNTEKSPYEILRKAYTYVPHKNQTLESDVGVNSAGASNSKAAGGTTKEEKKSTKNINNEIGLTARQRDIFDDALTYIRFKGDTFYFTYDKYQENLKQYLEQQQKSVDKLSNGRLGREMRRKMREITNNLNKNPQMAYDKRLYESAYQQKQRRQNAYVNKAFQKLTKQQMSMMWETMGIKEENTIKKLRDDFFKKTIDVLLKFKNMGFVTNSTKAIDNKTSQSQIIDVSQQNTKNASQENSYTKPK